MDKWTDRDLRRLREALEINLTIPRLDGGLHGPVTLWHGVIADQVYVRSARGTEAEWFRQATNTGAGIVEADDVRREVRLLPASGDDIRVALDRALHDKYDEFGPNPVLAITTRAAADATLHLVPASIEVGR